MTWMSFFIGYSVGMTLTVLIMKSVIESKEAYDPDEVDIDMSVINQMRQLDSIRNDKG